MNSMDSTQNTTIAFKSINYYLNNNKCLNRCPLPCFRKQRKQILHDLNGIFPVGLNAIMGPTGCGKSSLLDLLAYRKDRQGLEGEIYFNGQLQTSNFKYHVGYVVQDDILSGTLTVKENLIFSANIRLSSNVSSKEKQQIVDQVIGDLGLSKCADSIVGTDFQRGVSGGERKRTNIGMELVLSPVVLFLDEPTTGLDSSMARQLLECLHKLSRQGRTIIFSIHQPRYSIFKLFDRLFLIAAGHCIYHGPTESVLEFFSSAGFRCEEHDNPADFILDVLQQESVPKSESNENPTLSDKIEIYLNELYRKTDMFSSITSQISQINSESSRTNREILPNPNKSYLNEILYLSQRTLRNAFRNPALIGLQTAISIFLAILIGLIYLRIDLRVDVGVKNRSGAIFFIVTNQVFSNLSALELFLKERVLFVHENASGYYHTSMYFFSKIICDVIPLRTIPAAVFSVIVYFMMGFQASADRFFFFFLCIWLISICASSLCFVVSATVENFGIANIMAALVFVITLIFGGFLVDISSVLGFLRWIQYFSIFRYGSNALLINEFIGLTFCQSNNTNICTESGDQVLTNFKVDHATSWDLWQNVLALICITLGLFVLAYIQLRRIKRTK